MRLRTTARIRITSSGSVLLALLSLAVASCGNGDGATEDPVAAPRGQSLPEASTSTSTSVSEFDPYVTAPGEVVFTTVPLRPDERSYSWDVRGTTIEFRLPDGFALDPRPDRAPIDPGDDQVAGGGAVDVLYKWGSADCQCTISLSVQPRPEPGLPIYDLEPYGSLSANGLTWKLVNFGGEHESLALAMTNEQMINIIGPPELLGELVQAVETKEVAR